MNSDENSSAPASDLQRVNCYGCRHFFITWDKKFPYGCRKMEFRSKRLPSDDVIEADGQRCLAREEAPRDKVVRAQTSASNEIVDATSKSRKVKPRLGGSLNLTV
ncbi:MAG: hypothetical protein O3B02_05845 [Proteobacteria bacterium]|nr:hypothetical protein [Pseudomonadota bacterium]